MISLDDNEKVILQKNSSLLNGLSQKWGKLYLTNKRLIFEDSKNSGNNIYIQLSEIKSYKELKVFYKLTTGFEFVLDNGVHYCFNFFGIKSLLLKLEEVKGSSIEKEVGVKHHLLPNILFSVLILFWVIIPTVNFIGSSFDNIMLKSDTIGYIEDGELTINDPTYKSSEVSGYPNLHGEWVYTDENGLRTELKISMKDSEDYRDGKYKVIQSEGSYSFGEYGRDPEIKDFILVVGRDKYGDQQTLGCNKELYEKFGLDPENNSKYIFSIFRGRFGEPMLRMETKSWNIRNNMFGKGMTKLKNTVDF